MFWCKRRSPQPAEIRFIDDAPRPYVRTPAGARPQPQPVVPPPVPPPTVKAVEVAPSPTAKPKKKSGRGVTLLTAMAVFGTGVYLKEQGAFNHGAKAQLTMPAQIFSVSEEPVIAIDAFDGPIEVTRGTSGRVEVSVIKEASAKDQMRADAELRQVTVTSTGDDKKVTVTATRGSGQKLGESWVKVKVAAPADSSLQLRTANGEIRVGQVEGAIAAHTSNGAIKVNEARGQLDLDTTNGRITIDGEDVVVNAKTQSGGINFNGSLGEGESLFETTNGGVDVELPSDQSFRIDAKTNRGRIRNEFRNIKHETNGKSDHRVIGVVGNHPQSELKIRTSNGGIRVERD